MNTAAPSFSEAERLALLTATRLLDADPPPALDALVRAAARQSGCPAAQLNLIDAHRVFALARHGQPQRHFSREGSWCDQTILSRRPMVVSGEPVYPSNDEPSTAASTWRFYAGVPILVDDLALGTICVLDQHPRDDGSDMIAGLQDLAEAAAGLIQAQLNEHRHRRQEARIRTASLTGSDWLWETDQHGRIQWVSASLIQHTGLDPMAEVGLQARDIYTPRNDETRVSWERFQQARERREPFSDAIADRMTPRGRISVSISGTPVFNSRGQFMGYRGSSRNITRQLALERQTRYQDMLMRQAFDAIQGGIMISDPDGRIVLANRRWSEHTGIQDIALAPSWPELVRQLIWQGLYPEAQGREEEFFQWRMQLVEQDHPVPMRLRDAVVLTRDHRLPDGSTLHFSTDISRSQHEAVTLQDALQADLTLGLLVLDARAEGHPPVYLNAGAEHMLKASREELLGQAMVTALGRLHADEAALDQIRQALDARKPAVVLLATHTQQGGARTLELRLTPLRNAQDELVHTMGLLQDVTEREAAADKLRFSEELYRCVAATISDGLLVVQLDGRLVAMNPAGARILDMSRAQAHDLCGQELRIELLQDDLSAPLPQAQWPWWHTIQSGQRVNNQVYPVRRVDGDLSWIQLSCHPLTINSESTPFAVVATFRDITQERAAAQALARSEERWKFALEGAGDGVWDWSAGQGVVFHSSRWAIMLGYDDQATQEELGDWIERIHPEDRRPALHTFNEYSHVGEGILQVEMRVRHRLGHYIWVLARGKVVRRDEEGRPLRVVGTHSDITLLKEAERAQHDKRSAELANKAKTDFLSRMSHEIRTPLNAVRGFAQLLDQRLDPELVPDAADYVRQILISSELLSDLVNDVLDLQQIESGAITLQRETVFIADMVRQCATMLAPLCSRYQITLQTQIATGCRLLGDRRRLSQVTSNLVSNAIKYNRPGGSVRISAHHADDQSLVLRVEDTGIGMAPEQLARLFQPFERLGRDTSSIEGTGLGLIITKSLVEAMGGRLDIHSQPGVGTRITVTLPDHEASSAMARAMQTQDGHAGAVVNETHHLTPPHTAAAVLPTSSSLPSASPEPCTEHAPLRVMYVEDNRINALLFEEALRPYAELLLEVAEDGQTAMTVARSHQPDVLVIDAHLPGMTGFEVLRALRTVPGLEQVPAYMCSADALPEDIKRANNEGFVGYWTKPIDIQMITSELCRLAQQGRAAS
ncbi:MAG TPA: PAS domain S-box protein [Aquabacterium sp.]|uniref:PAS domain S-box protein n=1 Tax=Aquabacterium sp. TaxID=1872578 RepID=UPI002E2F102D|nr:PAS domain S-box protein [Aquabacterium sp.]HEX5374366.1 PAS domain S-box protein [Aquabacterium sp.]